MALQSLIWRTCYDLLARHVQAPGWAFMNYGYATLATDATDATDSSPVSTQNPDRLCIQLYLRAIDGTDLTDLDVLEVGSGRGGGASYINSHLHPRSMTGLDFSGKAVALCDRDRSAPGLTFVCGDALSMPFPDASFDSVINIESSHCYQDMAQFLAEVARVLRPGGRFFFADLRSAEGAELLRVQLASSGLDVLNVTDISSNVVAALAIDNERKIELIKNWIPRPFRGVMRVFAGLEGTMNHRRLESGAWRYLAAHLTKPISLPQQESR